MSELGSFDRCGACGKYDFLGRHKCAPAWEVFWPYGHEDWTDAATVHALSAQYAAEEWASSHDSNGDYDIVGGSEATVRVRPKGEDGLGLEFIVTGETVPEYHARESA